MKRTLFLSLIFVTAWAHAAVVDHGDGTYSVSGDNQTWRADPDDGRNGYWELLNTTTNTFDNSDSWPTGQANTFVGFDYDSSTSKFTVAATPTTGNTSFGSDEIWLGNSILTHGNLTGDRTVTMHLAKNASVNISGAIGWKTTEVILDYGDLTNSSATITQKSGAAIWDMQKLTLKASYTMKGTAALLEHTLMDVSFRESPPTSISTNLSVTGLDGEALEYAGIISGMDALQNQTCALLVNGGTIKFVAKDIDQLYWRGTSATANWSDAVWSVAADGTGSLVAENGVPVYFAQDQTATITVDTAVNPTGITVSKGNYTFAGTNTPLDSTDALTVETGGKATFDMNIAAATVSISGAESALTGANITVKNTLSMESGSLKATELNGTAAVQINGGKLELSNGSKTTGTTIADGVELAGSTSLSGTYTNLNLGKVTVKDAAADVSISNTTLSAGATVEGGSLKISDAGLGAAIRIDSGSLALEGSIILSNTLIVENVVVYSGDGVEIGTATNNGYANGTTVFQVATGTGLSGVDATQANWSEGKRIIIDYIYDGTTGKVTKTGLDLSTYHVNNDSAISGLTLLDSTQSICINEKTLTIDGQYDDYSKGALLEASASGGTVMLDANGELSSSDISITTGDLELDGSGTYSTNNSADLHQSDKVSLAGSWSGTVDAGNISGDAVDISSLANAYSSIKMGTVQAKSIQLDAAQSVYAQSLKLTGTTPSTLNAEEVTLDNLTLGSDAGASSLTINGVLDMQGDITLGHEGSSVTALALSDNTAELNFAIDADKLDNISRDVVVLTLTDAAGDVLLTLNNQDKVIRDKYAYIADWTNGGTQVIISPTFNEAYYGTAVTSHNGAAGETIITGIVADQSPQESAPDSNLASVLNSLDALMESQDANGADRLMSAVAGASTAAMGAALAGDVQRQLRAIRNRTTTMGVDQCVVNHDMPYLNAWINAEANRSELDADGTNAGYTMDSWGGTVGFDVDLDPQTTIGLAFTAMYGEFTADSTDVATGDMDTYYLTAFARYVSNRWTHTFVATAGMAETSLKRTVAHAGGSYTASGDSDGFTLGAMYEVGYVCALDEDATTCLQPVLNVTFAHSSLSGYTEKDSDAALKVGDMDMTTFTVGLGARLQTTMGENIYNRTSLLEARALIKANMGDSSCDGDVAFASLPGVRGSLSSSELDTVSFELGAGLTIPLGQEDGALFADASAELSGSYTDLNATVGYRYNF